MGPARFDPALLCMGTQPFGFWQRPHVSSRRHLAARGFLIHLEFRSETGSDSTEIRT
jgi:hypothetical protein